MNFEDREEKRGLFVVYVLCAYLIVKCMLSSGLFSGVFLQGLSFFSYLCLTHCRKPYLPSQRSHWWLCVPPAYHNQSSAAQKYLSYGNRPHSKLLVSVSIRGATHKNLMILCLIKTQHNISEGYVWVW